MSCRRTEQLDALVLGELSAPAARELSAHAARCAPCALELRWLESERALFRQRAARAEVGALWRTLPERRRPQRASWAALVAFAASALLVWGVQRLVRAPGVPQTDEAWPMSEETMSLERAPWVPSSEIGGTSGCSGLGFACGPASEPVAARD
ncbi:MAG: hypothetical protein K1X89_21220 [Myxococcaceae bacterium]|nr:hypothetical protein [Myxococcaceae bacterium]